MGRMGNAPAPVAAGKTKGCAAGWVVLLGRPVVKERRGREIRAEHEEIRRVCVVG